jgi:hypothetical protein
VGHGSSIPSNGQEAYDLVIRLTRIHRYEGGFLGSPVAAVPVDGALRELVRPGPDGWPRTVRSLDGYIAGPNDEPGNSGRDGFDRLHELEIVRVIDTPEATHIHYRVRR